MHSLNAITRTPSNENFQVTYPSGNIKRLPVSQRKKYEDAPDEDCFTIRFTEEGLRNTQTHYKKLQGVPRFLHDIFNSQPSQHRVSLVNRPEQHELFKAGKDYFFINPNSLRMSFEGRIKDPKNVKNTDEGVSLCVWYIPKTYISTPVAQALLYPSKYKKLKKKYEEIQKKGTQALRYGESGSAEREKFERSQSLGRTYSVSQEMERLPTQKSISEIEDETKERYLASILDLTKDDVPMLEELRNRSYVHLEKAYGVDKVKDDVKLFFHFSYMTDTATLHLHIRTAPTHPIDDARIFHLDDIIKTLNDDTTIFNMVLARKSVGENLPSAYLHTEALDEWYNSLGNIKGVTFAPAKNPKLLSDLPYNKTYQRRPQPLVTAESIPSAPYFKDEDIPLTDDSKSSSDLANYKRHHPMRTRSLTKAESMPSAPYVKDEYIPLTDDSKSSSDLTNYDRFHHRTRSLPTVESTSLKRKEAEFTPSTPLKPKSGKRKKALGKGII